MRTGSSRWYPLLPLMVAGALISGCGEGIDLPGDSDTIVYKPDGRTVSAADPLPIPLDLTEDGLVDFTVFVELTANSLGDRLYTGVNPIGGNLIKSGPSNEQNFLSMGLLIAEPEGTIIDAGLESDQQWTSEHSALAIRTTLTNGGISYEGEWADAAQIVGIQHFNNGSFYFGWLRIGFDKITEVVTLIDYAYDTTASRPIRAGVVPE